MDQTKGEGDVDETSVCELNPQMNAYYKSKIRAEMEAYKFMNELKEKEKTFDMCTVHPGFITGPPLIPNIKGMSLTFIKDVLMGTVKGGIPQIYLPHTDVTDVAKAHLIAIEKGRNCEKYSLNSGTYKIVELAEIVRKNYEPKGYPVTTKELGKCMVWLASWFNADAKNLLWLWNVRVHCKADKVKKEFGMDFIDAEKSIKDMVDQYIKDDLVAKP